MRQFTTDQLSGLLVTHEPPCISLYQPTHRQHAENQQDPIRYRKLAAITVTVMHANQPMTSHAERNLVG